MYIDWKGAITLEREGNFNDELSRNLPTKSGEECV